MNGTTRRVAVVSGGSSGIGLATVQTLLGQGWRVAYFSQNRQRVEETYTALADQHNTQDIHAATVDLRDADAVRAFFSAAGERFGRIDALVANAGFSPKNPSGRTPLAEISLDEWRDVFTVNLTGALVCCQAALPGMAAQRHGRIVLIGSVAGRTLPRIAGASYVASKSALVGLMRSIVSEYAGQGITANAICPGRILTEMTGDPASPNNQAALARIPAGRLGRPEDIARAVAFLLADEAGFVNGAVLDINGGEFAAP